MENQNWGRKISMEIKEHLLKGVYEIILKPYEDERGFFMRVYDKKTFNDNEIFHNWVQENHSFTKAEGTVRGLHLQLQPYSETKLVRCIKGKILDVFLDLRKNSDTFGLWSSLELSPIENNCILIPKGFAHGYCALENFSEVIYKVDNYYRPDFEVGIYCKDKDLKIDWRVSNIILSDKDSKNLKFNEFLMKYGSIDIGDEH